MKILLSAYACEPCKGSEQGLGWNWALELTRLGHDVWVLTRANNRASIELILSTLPEKTSLHFIYYDLPNYLLWIKKIKGGIYLYYCMWQWGAYHITKYFHIINKFDLVHHVTFASANLPSFMWKLGIPFVFGPIAGGEKAPWRLRLGYSFKGFILDSIRDIRNFIIKLNPLMRLAFSKAQIIFVTSKETRRLIPSQYHFKTCIHLAIGSENISVINTNKYLSSTFKLVYVGRFLYWKGIHIGLAAFAIFVKKYPTARITLVGEGSEKTNLRNLAKKLSIENNIDWLPWVAHEKLQNIFINHDVLLFPSLHDSGGMVVLEAMSCGLPVLCLDLGGPGIIVDDTCGFAIVTDGKSEKEIISQLADKLEFLFINQDVRLQLANGALARSKQFHWQNVVSSIYEEVEKVNHHLVLS